MVQSTTFENGLTLVTETYPGLRSASACFWVGAGSGNETSEINGISHFTEHVMFKGTNKYSSFEISKLFEDYGALTNAFTGKENTCYYFKCIDENFEKSLDLLSHIFFESIFDDEELDKERKVILEEINMVSDAPDEICMDILAQKTYADTALAQTILGSPDNVKKFKGDDVRRYIGKMYTPDNIILSIAGNITHAEAIKFAEKYVLPRCGNGKREYGFCKKASKTGGFIKYEKDFEQVNMAFAFPSIPFNGDKFSEQNIVSFCLGSGMSSRLFQVLREQKGLVYNVFSSGSGYKNNGIFAVYVNTSGKNVAETIKSIKEETVRIANYGISNEEYERAKVQLKSSLLFGHENILSTMNTNAKYMLYERENFDIDKKINLINNTSLNDVNEYLKTFAAFDSASVAYVGKKEFAENINIFAEFVK